MKFKTMLALVAALGTFAFAGCEVEKTQEGDADVTLPEYDVQGPDVNTGTTTTQVTVPTVDIDVPEERNIQPSPAPNE